MPPPTPSSLGAEVTVHMLSWVEVPCDYFLGELQRKLPVFMGVWVRKRKTLKLSVLICLCLHIHCNACSHHWMKLAASFQLVPRDWRTSLVRCQCQAQVL